jgi:hypothetical protein
MSSCFSITAQLQDTGITGANNWLGGWTSFKANKHDYNETTKILYGTIDSNFTLSGSETYLLQGNVYVTNNAVLTIEPGTIIRGDTDNNGVLIITKGAKIKAEGTANSPIVFTSNKDLRKPGDWGGIIIIGEAPVNSFGGIANVNYEIDYQFRTYGGANAESDAGSMKYVRIEFAGRSIVKGQKLSGLTLAGVGDKTKLSNIQVSHCEGNSITVLGGNVNATNIISYKAKNNDLDFTQGTQSNFSNCLIIKNAFASSNESRCITIASYEKKDNVDFNRKLTKLIVDNCTIVNETDGEAFAGGIIKEAIYINNNTTFSLRNSIISGFESPILFNSELQITDLNLKKINIQGVFFNNCKSNMQSELGGTADADLEDYYSSPNLKNRYSKTPVIDLFIAPKSDKTPDYRIKIDKIN